MVIVVLVQDHVASIYAWCDAIVQAIALFNSKDDHLELEDYLAILDIVSMLANDDVNLERVWTAINTLRSDLTVGLVTRRQRFAGTHSHTRSLARSLTRSLARSLTRSLARSLTHDLAFT
jgi:hypothetical protein